MTMTQRQALLFGAAAAPLRHSWPFRRCLQTVLALGLLIAGSALAEVRALVIGIDAYRHIGSLQGAVMDAQDVAQALRQIGVTDLTLRLNEEVTRDTLDQDWQELLARSQSGDTLVLTYAGHGSQKPERVAGNEEDGKDEMLLLADYADKGPGRREQLVDDELYKWFREANDRGLELLFVADACHSGTLTRGMDPRAGAGRVRYTPYITDDDLELDLPTPTTSSPGEDDLPRLTFLAGAQENQTVPEIPLLDAQGHHSPRGALSWAFARALEGQADQNSDAKLTRDEVNRFVRANVRAIAESRQTPNLLPMTDGGRVVLPVAAATRSAPLAIKWPEARIRIRASDPRSAAKFAGELTGITQVDDSEDADLILDIHAGQAISGSGRVGDVLARDLVRPAWQTVIDKWRGTERLKFERLGDKLTMRVLPNDSIHRQGQEMAFEIDDIRLPYLVFFSLSGDGTLNFHYPLPEDPETVPMGRPVRVDFKVTPPYGADHIIAVASDQTLGELTALLRSLDGKPAPRPALEAVIAVLRQGNRQLGLQGLYTAP
jgi:hypothetical protein